MSLMRFQLPQRPSASLPNSGVRVLLERLLQGGDGMEIACVAEGIGNIAAEAGIFCPGDWRPPVFCFPRLLAEVKSFEQIGICLDDQVLRIGKGSQAGLGVERTSHLAGVAAKYAFAQERTQLLRNRSAVLDGPIAEAAAGVHRALREQRSRGAGLHALITLGTGVAL